MKLLMFFINFNNLIYLSPKEFVMDNKGGNLIFLRKPIVGY